MSPPIGRNKPIAALNARELAERAAEVLDPAVFHWFAGGAGDERTLRENEVAYRRWLLRPRTLTGIREASTATTVLGQEVELPVLLAPVAFHRLAHPDAEPATARAAAAAGTVLCVSTMATASFAEIAAAAPGARRWFQLYHLADRGRTRALVEAALEAGASALVLTIDAPVRGRRERELRQSFRLPAPEEVPNVAAVLGPSPPGGLEGAISRELGWEDVERLAGEVPVPLLVKGVLTGEDADRACGAGAAGIVVSNHGGRQLDGVPAGIDVLPEVAEAVGGRAELLVDGGVRRGTDVLIALALGARAVFVGRPMIWALATGGGEGVRGLLAMLREEVALALTLLGCDSPTAVRRAHVTRGGPPVPDR